MANSDIRCVSVVLPTHNRAHTIGRAISSVLNQTYGHLELIIVDDGSSDGTTRFVRQHFRDPRIRVLRLEHNQGASVARNLGVANARFELIAFMDSDDAWVPQKLAVQIDVLSSAPPTTGLVFSPYRRFTDDQAQIVGAGATHLDHAHLRQRLLVRNEIGTPTVLVKKPLISAGDGFDPALPRLQDWELWLRLSTRTHFIGVEEPLVDVYLSRDSITLDATKRLVALRAIIARHHRAFAGAGSGVLAKHLATLGHLEAVHGDFRSGRRLLLKAAQLAPRRTHLLRAALALAGGRAYRRYFVS